MHMYKGWRQSASVHPLGGGRKGRRRPPPTAARKPRHAREHSRRSTGQKRAMGDALPHEHASEMRTMTSDAATAGAEAAACSMTGGADDDEDVIDGASEEVPEAEAEANDVLPSAAEPSADLPSTSEMLPSKSIRHIMKRSMGGEHEALTADALAAVQRCTSEMVSMIVSESRVKAVKEGRTTVGYADIMGVLSTLGFKYVLKRKFKISPACYRTPAGPSPG